MTDTKKQGNNKKENKSSNIYKTIAIVCMTAAVICLAVYAYQLYSKNKAADALEDLRDQAVETVTEAVTGEEDDWNETYDRDIYEATGEYIEARNIDWDALYEENEDIYGWIYIPNTNVDYPVLQDPESDDYYLLHNIDGSSGYPGCIYSEPTYNSRGWDDPCTVLYGHNMKNKSMFATLHNFEDEDFFNENRYIYVYTPEQTIVYAIYGTNQFSDDHILYYYDFSDETGANAFDAQTLTSSSSMNHQNEEAVKLLNSESKRLILSTCISYAPNNRFIVMGVRLN